MNKPIPAEAFGSVNAPQTIAIERILPGPIERVWSYLVDGDLRRKWLAAGVMEQRQGAAFTLTWRNDELTSPPGKRPESFGEEHSLESRVIEIDPPRRLVFAWGQGEVAIDLALRGESVRLTLIHRRISDRKNMVMIGAGWHAHLDVLAARLSGAKDAEPFWDHWAKLKQDYEDRIPK